MRVLQALQQIDLGVQVLARARAELCCVDAFYRVRFPARMPRRGDRGLGPSKHKPVFNRKTCKHRPKRAFSDSLSEDLKLRASEQAAPRTDKEADVRAPANSYQLPRVCLYSHLFTHIFKKNLTNLFKHTYKQLCCFAAKGKSKTAASLAQFPHHNVILCT